MSSTILIEGYCNVRIPDLLQLLPITGEGSKEKEKRHERIRTRAHKRYSIPRTVKLANAKTQSQLQKRELETLPNQSKLKRRKVIIFDDRCRKHRRRAYLLSNTRSHEYIGGLNVSGSDIAKSNDNGVCTTTTNTKNRIAGIWLETHLWHAKRFHMGTLWGHVLPLMHNERCRRNRLGARAHNKRRSCNTRRIVAGCKTARTPPPGTPAPAAASLKQGQVDIEHMHTVSVSDMSFTQPIEITLKATRADEMNDLLQLLGHFIDIQTHNINNDSTPLMVGAVELECMCHRRDCFPQQALGPITLQFLPGSSARSLWIWTHPLFRSVLAKELNECVDSSGYKCLVTECMACPPVRLSLRGGISACRQVLKDIFAPPATDGTVTTADMNAHNNSFYSSLLESEGLGRVWAPNYCLPISIQDCRKLTSRGLSVTSRKTPRSVLSSCSRVGRSRLLTHMETFKSQVRGRVSTTRRPYLRWPLGSKKGMCCYEYLRSSLFSRAGREAVLANRIGDEIINAQKSRVNNNRFKVVGSYSGASGGVTPGGSKIKTDEWHSSPLVSSTKAAYTGVCAASASEPITYNDNIPLMVSGTPFIMYILLPFYCLF